MKTADMKVMTDEEILKALKQEEENLIDLKFQNALKNLTNTAKITSTRHDVARMKTILRERELKAVKSKD